VKERLLRLRDGVGIRSEHDERSVRYVSDTAQSMLREMRKFLPDLLKFAASRKALIKNEDQPVRGSSSDEVDQLISVKKLVRFATLALLQPNTRIRIEEHAAVAHTAIK
jgi:hypothetical protein